MKFKRVLALLLITALCTALFVPVLAAEGAAPLIKIVALGDSVPAHYGVSKDEGYIALLSAKLAERGLPNTAQNLAVSGLTSEGLMKQFEDEETITALANADIVTLNIGGNDLLQPLFGLLMQSGGLENIDIEKATALIVENKEMFEKGVDGFCETFPLIADKIDTLAPKAALVVSTIYNPFPKTLEIFAPELYALTDELICRMNEDIKDCGDWYMVADTYSTFLELSLAENPVDTLNFDLAGGNLDIHPNAVGHAVMAEHHANEILGGASGMSPSEPLTRAIAMLIGHEYIDWLVILAAAGEIEIQPHEPEQFSDVAPESSVSGVLLKARWLGLISGVGGNMFMPDDVMTRQDYAVVAMRAVALATGKPLSAFTETLKPGDMELVSDYARESVIAALALGIFKLDGGGFNPKEPADVRDAVLFNTIIMRLLETSE